MDIFDDTELIKAASDLANALLKQNINCATAESCTGGLLAAIFTSISGSSNWFERGYVTYSNQAKIHDLGVSASTIDKFGAVSEPTAQAMASGLLLNLDNVSLGLATTGVAGPTGGTAAKPVGMVCFGIARRIDNKISVNTFTRIFKGDRNQVRLESTKNIIKAALLEI